MKTRHSVKRLINIILVLGVSVFLASCNSYTDTSQSEKNIIDLAKWQEGTNLVGKEFILGSGEINRSGWGGGIHPMKASTLTNFFLVILTELWHWIMWIGLVGLTGSLQDPGQVSKLKSGKKR